MNDERINGHTASWQAILWCRYDVVEKPVRLLASSCCHQKAKLLCEILASSKPFGKRAVCCINMASGWWRSYSAIHVQLVQRLWQRSKDWTCLFNLWWTNNPWRNRMNRFFCLAHFRSVMQFKLRLHSHVQNKWFWGWIQLSPCNWMIQAKCLKNNWQKAKHSVNSIMTIKRKEETQTQKEGKKEARKRRKKIWKEGKKEVCK